MMKTGVKNEKESAVAEQKEKGIVVRRQMLISAIASLAVAKSAEASQGACLAPPNCDEKCTNGGIPKGDGTQDCECTPDDCIEPKDLARVAYTGKYSDLKDQPVKSSLDVIGKEGTAGPSADVTLDQTNNKGPTPSPTKVVIPYFKVDSMGRITAYGNRTLTLTTNLYSNYTNYQAYANYAAYANYKAYSDYSAYKNYSASSHYYNYYDQCCGDSDTDGSF